MWHSAYSYILAHQVECWDACNPSVYYTYTFYMLEENEQWCVDVATVITCVEVEGKML